MKNVTIAIAASAFALFASAGIVTGAGQAPPPDAVLTPQQKQRPTYATDRVLVAFQPQASSAAQAALAQRYGLRASRKSRSRYFSVLNAPTIRNNGDPIPALIKRLRNEPAVRIAEPSYIWRTCAIPNDTSFGDLWGLHNTGQAEGLPDADIDAPEAWDITQGSETIRVAVIDTGVDYNHPDLAANILRDQSQRVIGYDFLADDADPMDEDEHGTHCAGTIGAVGNNSLGVIGVCPKVRIMPLRFIGPDGGSTEDAIGCIDFARTNGARVMSNS